MSLILDALRKMEQDRRNRPAPAAALRPEVLRYRAQTAKRKRKKPYLLACLVLLVVAAGIGAGMFALGRRDAVSAGSPAAAPVAQSVPATAPASAVAPLPPASPALPVTAQAKPPQPLAAPPAAAVAPAAVAVEARPQDVTDVPAQPKPAKVKRARLPQVKPERRDNNNDAMQGSPQDITISGIAWQEERNLRRAVLNGTLVAEGAQVAGARVVEIKEDRVRLSRGGQSFDVVFSSALSSR